MTPMLCTIDYHLIMKNYNKIVKRFYEISSKTTTRTINPIISIRTWKKRFC